MAIDKNLLKTSADDVCVGNPSDHKGGPGTYDGISGYPQRTHSPNALPEKVIDGQPPLTKGKE